MSDMLERPLFVVTSKRSGTTLLGLMLGNHPELAWAGEMDFLVNRLSDEGGFPDTGRYHEAISSDRMFYTQELTFDPELPYPELVRSFLEQNRARAGKKLIGATVHVGFHRLPRLWPEARYVHLVRDGRDVAHSCIRMGWAGNMWTAADEWRQAAERWAELCSLVPEHRRLAVHYEELVRQPERVLSEIVGLIGLDYHPEMLRYHERSTYAPLDPSRAEGWTRFPRRDVELCEARIGNLLAAYGYEPSSRLRHEPSALERTWLRAHDKIERARFRQRFYGPLLASGEIVTRRLRLERLHRPIRRRMDQIEIARLQ